MSHNKLMVIQIETIENLSLEEVCLICQVTPEFVYELMNYGIIEVRDQFNESHLKRIQMLKRLQEDLEINLAGAALALDLMDEIDQLRIQLDIVEKHFR